MDWLRRIFGRGTAFDHDADVVLRRALLAVLDRDFETAEKLLERAVKLDSESVENNNKQVLPFIKQLTSLPYPL